MIPTIKREKDKHISKSDKNSIEHNDKTIQNQNTENTSNEQKSNEERDSKDTIEDVSSQNNNQIDFSNIKDRSTLESIIYGNYSEEQKIQAYNSAVANGIIPQGNVMEGPASVAYQSSLRVENGQEKSIYDRPNESDVSVDDENATPDPNAEINAAETEDEYYDALRKNIMAVFHLENFKQNMQLSKVTTKVMTLKKSIKTLKNKKLT